VKPETLQEKLPAKIDMTKLQEANASKNPSVYHEEHKKVSGCITPNFETKIAAYSHASVLDTPSLPVDNKFRQYSNLQTSSG
jgi:hypothetical protein